MKPFFFFLTLKAIQDEEHTIHYWIKWPSVQDSLWATCLLRKTQAVLLLAKEIVNRFFSTSPAHPCVHTTSNCNCLVQTAVQNNFLKTYFWYQGRYNWRHCLHWFMGGVGICFYSCISYQTTNSESNKVTLICWSVMNVHGFMVRIMQ